MVVTSWGDVLPASQDIDKSYSRPGNALKGGPERHRGATEVRKIQRYPRPSGRRSFRVNFFQRSGMTFQPAVRRGSHAGFADLMVLCGDTRVKGAQRAAVARTEGGLPHCAGAGLRPVAGRDLEARVKAGKSAGGISYGYKGDRSLRADGQVTTGAPSPRC
ncbi:hypothetical protein GCM10011341_35830 [Frigidibacter albus]|nr:hypothetical protein GCM10011341_35830 [Frigidibacter albus]